MGGLQADSRHTAPLAQHCDELLHYYLALFDQLDQRHQSLAGVAKIFGQLLTVFFLDNLVQFSPDGSLLFSWFCSARFYHIAPQRTAFLSTFHYLWDNRSFR